MKHYLHTAAYIMKLPSVMYLIINEYRLKAMRILTNINLADRGSPA